MPGLGSMAPLPGMGGEGYQRLTPWPLNAYPPNNQRIPAMGACACTPAVTVLAHPDIWAIARNTPDRLGVAGAVVDVAVGDRDRELVAIAIAVGQVLGYCNRAVAAAGAADCDHQVGLALGHILGQ